MLGKLLKYEWKSTGRVLPLIYLAILVLSLCVGFSLRNTMYAHEGLGQLLFISVYVILIVAMIVVTIVVIIERFYRSMISQEGYLMHTLPVKPWQHILSKTCMAVVWGIIAVAVIVVSFFLIGAISGLLKELLSEIGFRALINEMEFFLNKFQIAMIIVCGVVQMIRLVMQLYLAMAIGGTSVKSKVAFSFLAFIVIAIVVSVIATVISMAAIFGITSTEEYNQFWMAVAGDAMSQEISYLFNRMFVIQLIMDGGFLAIFYVLTNYFLGKRLNLE